MAAKMSKLPTDHQGAVCATCRHALKPRHAPDSPGGWCCTAVPSEVILGAWKDHITGEEHAEVRSFVQCRDLNSQGQCTLYALGIPQTRKGDTPVPSNETLDTTPAQDNMLTHTGPALVGIALCLGGIVIGLGLLLKGCL